MSIATPKTDSEVVVASVPRESTDPLPCPCNNQSSPKPLCCGPLDRLHSGRSTNPTLFSILPHSHLKPRGYPTGSLVFSCCPSESAIDRFCKLPGSENPDIFAPRENPALDLVQMGCSK